MGCWRILEDVGGFFSFVCLFLPRVRVPVPFQDSGMNYMYIYIYIYTHIYIFVIVLKAKLVQMPRADLGSIPILMPMLGAHAMPVSTPNGSISVGVAWVQR